MRKAALYALVNYDIERITARDGKVMVIFYENKIVKMILTLIG